MDGPWGGIPLDGRKEAEMEISASNDNGLVVNEYSLSLPVGDARPERTVVKKGRQRLDLAGYRGILSFRLERADPAASFILRLA